jgi:hypothetical protein
VKQFVPLGRHIMKKLCVAAVLLSALALACTGSDGEGPGDGGVGDGGVGDGGAGDGGTDGGLVITNPGGGTTVNLSFGTCPAFSACGGDEHGTWDYTAVCDTEDYAEQIKQSCPSATIKSLTGTKKGTVLIVGSGIARDVVTTINMVVTIPGSCATPLGGCSGVQTAIQQGLPGATCSATGTAGACDCSATITGTIRDSTTYTRSGSRITVANGDVYDFCITGSKMTYMEGGNDPTSGVFEMTKR